jgi:hypothetical protein
MSQAKNKVIINHSNKDVFFNTLSQKDEAVSKPQNKPSFSVGITVWRGLLRKPHLTINCVRKFIFLQQTYLWKLYSFLNQ